MKRTALLGSATRSVLKAFLRIASWLLLAIAAMAFWAGGRAISEFAKVDRILAEFLGLLLAAVTGVAGYLLKVSADDLDRPEDSPSQ